MGERKFTKGLGRPGMAAQLRETVSQVVRDNSNNQKSFQVLPLDFEDYVAKNQTVLQNDPQRELLLYPADDVSQVVLPRRYRTVDCSVPDNINTTDCSLLTKRSIESYLSNWNVIHYKYSAYSGSYIQLLSDVKKNSDLIEEIYEIDTDLEKQDKDCKTVKNDSALFKQGHLYRGPDGVVGGSERMFANFAGSKSFKRRFCILKQQVDCTYILEIYKDEKKCETKATIVMELCEKVIRNSKKGRYCFELRMTDTDKTYCLAADTESELMDWISKLELALQYSNDKREEKMPVNNKEFILNEKKISSLPFIDSFGTLKGLEHSVNPQLIKYARETESLIALSRQKNRRRLFAVYPNLHQPSSYIKQNILNQPVDVALEPYKERFGQRLLVECLAINFKLQLNNEENNELVQVEPYFTTLALFDVRAGKKISEDFHFDINHDSLSKLVKCNNQNDGSIELAKNCKVFKSWLFKQKQAIMCVSKPHSDIFLVLRVDKVLQGSIVRVSEPYIKASSNNKDGGLKVFKAVKNICQRLGNYRMPFAWSAKPLFRLYSCELDTSNDSMTLYRQDISKLGDDDMIKILMDYRKPEKMNKFVVIPGHVSIKIQQLTNYPENVLTTCWTPVKPFSIPPNQKHPIIEIVDFIPDPQPQTAYINNMYVYPLSLTLDTQKNVSRARNITCMVQLFENDDGESKPLNCIYGSNGQLLDSVCTNVSYHNTNPTWYNEIKIKLPVHITTKHHLLFTLKHISVDGSRKKQSHISVDTVVGYTWLPLISKSKLNTDLKILPISVNLPAGYLSIQPFGLGKGYCGPEIFWFDGQKPLFSFKCHLLSSVYSSDNHMQNLFAHSERLENSKVTTIIPAESETCKILKASHAIDLVSVIHFLPTLLNQLFNLLTFASSDNIATNIIRLLIHIVDSVQEFGQCDLLNIYIKYVFTAPSTKLSNFNVHDQLLANLPSLLKPDNTDFLLINKFLVNSNFFLQIVIKSMGQYLLTTNRIKMRRNERFSLEYQSRVQHLLIDVLLPYVTIKHKEMSSQVAKLNIAVAHFLKKCLTFMDRGFILQLINMYICNLSTCDSTFVRSAKLLFMRTIISHEHYISFNLPVQNGQTPQGWSPHSQFYLSDEYCRHHFLTAILLREVSNSFCLPYEYRHSAIACLRDILAKHELDDRYQSKGLMARIASLYLPWLGVITENVGRLDYRKQIHNKIVKRPPNFSSSRSNKLPNEMAPRMSLNLRDSTYFAAIANHLTPSKKLINQNQQHEKLIKTNSNSSINSCASNLSSPDKTNSSSISQETIIRKNSNVCEPTGPINNRHSRSVSGTQSYSVINDTSVNIVSKLEPAEVKDVLVCFLFVLKYSSQDQLIAWWRYCSEPDIMAFFKIIELCLQEFRYIGRQKIIEDVTAASNRDNVQPTSTTATKKSMTLPARMQPPTEFNEETTANSNCQNQTASPPILNSNGTGSIGRGENLKKDSSTSEDDFVFRVLAEANLSAEVGLITLDALSSYCVHFKDTLMAYNGENNIMESVFSVLMTFLCIAQSTSVCGHVFATLRSFINQFSCILFKGTAHLVGKLCTQLLNGCNSRSSTIRQESCAALYLLMRSNFELSSSNITRVHLQTVIAVSQLLGDLTSAGLNNSRFQESLALINSYANSDKIMKNTGFPVQVKDLTRRVRTVLMATSRMKDLNHDPEMLADLQHSLANSYASTPELRLTWLQTMARNHDENGDFSEAACCRLHIAALTAQYRKLRGSQEWGAEAFASISSNVVRDETALQLDSGGSVAANDALYGEQALLDRLESCAASLRRAELYECFGHLYKLVIPVYERRKDYHALADCYRTVGNAYDAAVSARQSGRRMLGRYYRVTLFGQAYFGDQHGIEFVYKEPKLTPLSDVSERLLQQYGDKFGRDNVRIIMDSSTISISELDVKFAYIQITHVVPYHGEKYMEIDNDSVSEFERNHDIDSFVFETPFTRDSIGISGQSLSGPRDQWKRQTIIKTEYMFPYVKKRLRVCSRHEIEQCPIQVAIDEMYQRVRELKQAVSAQPTDVKKLQLRLQGSVCVQVNAGPLAYAKAFLEPQIVLELPADKVQDLKDTFREFISACFDALKLNRMVVSADQIEYQQALQENFVKMCRELSECVESDSLLKDVLLSCTSPGSDSRTLFTAISGASHDSSNA